MQAILGCRSPLVLLAGPVQADSSSFISSECGGVAEALDPARFLTTCLFGQSFCCFLITLQLGFVKICDWLVDLSFSLMALGNTHSIIQAIAHVIAAVKLGPIHLIALHSVSTTLHIRLVVQASVRYVDSVSSSVHCHEPCENNVTLRAPPSHLQGACCLT